MAAVTTQHATPDGQRPWGRRLSFVAVSAFGSLSLMAGVLIVTGAVIGLRSTEVMCDGTPMTSADGCAWTQYAKTHTELFLRDGVHTSVAGAEVRDRNEMHSEAIHSGHVGMVVGIIAIAIGAALMAMLVVRRAGPRRRREPIEAPIPDTTTPMEVRLAWNRELIITMVANVLIGGLFVVGATAVFVSGYLWGLGLLLGPVGVVVLWFVLMLARRVIRHDMVAAIDADGVTFPVIKDPSLRRWEWTDVTQVRSVDIPLAHTKINALRFVLADTLRATRLRNSLPAHYNWPIDPEKRFHELTTVRFAVGVRPKRPDVLAYLQRVAPHLL